MRNRPANWERLAVRGEFSMNTVAVINGVTYDTITAPVIKSALLSDSNVGVGNCIASTLEFTVMTRDSIPKSAQIVIKSSISDGTTTTSTMDFGTFWVNERTVEDDLITLKCYDAMMMGNQAYSDDSQSLNWPKPMTTVVNRICQQMGVQLDARTVIRTGGDYECTKPNDDETLLDVLGYIAGMHGGNWIITPENKLRLVTLVSPCDETFDVVDDVYDKIYTDDGYKLVHELGGATVPVTNPTGGGLINVPVVVGKATTGRAYTITRVTVTNPTITVEGAQQQHGATYTAALTPDNGYNLIVPDNPYATQALCNTLLQIVGGVVYQPFDVTSACFDPATELGDWIIVGDIVRGVVYSISQTLDIAYHADVSAPGKDEIESEYPFKTATQKMQYTLQGVQNDAAVMKTEIQQTQQQVAIKASKGDIRAAFELGIVDDGQQTPGEDVRSYVRLQASEVSWESDNSEMTAAGILKCKGSRVVGDVIAANRTGTGSSSDKSNYTVTTIQNGRLNMYSYVDVSNDDKWLESPSTSSLWSTLYTRIYSGDSHGTTYLAAMSNNLLQLVSSNVTADSGSSRIAGPSVLLDVNRDYARIAPTDSTTCYVRTGKSATNVSNCVDVYGSNIVINATNTISLLATGGLKVNGGTGQDTTIVVQDWSGTYYELAFQDGVLIRKARA